MPPYPLPSLSSVLSFFMYVFMVSGILLLVFIIHYVYTTVRRVGIGAQVCYNYRAHLIVELSIYRGKLA